MALEMDYIKAMARSIKNAIDDVGLKKLEGAAVKEKEGRGEER
jgi:hypothetical protein